MNQEFIKLTESVELCRLCETFKYSILHYKGRNTAIANEREVFCPSEARAAVTQVVFAVFCFE